MAINGFVHIFIPELFLTASKIIKPFFLSMPKKSVKIEESEEEEDKEDKPDDQNSIDKRTDTHKKFESSSESEPENENYVKLDKIELKNKTKGRSKTGRQELRKKQIINEKVRKHRREVIEKKEKKIKEKSSEKGKKRKSDEDLLGTEDRDVRNKKSSSALDRFR